MTRSCLKIIAVGGALLCVAGLAVVFFHRDPSAFFTAELSRVGAHETVTVRGTTYEVRSGSVAAARPGDAIAALRLAYAQELARRAPILGIEGTGPAALRENTDALRRAVDRLANAQASSSSATLVHSLYPIAFLTALADAEDARQSFLTVGSDVNEARYESALGSAIEAGSRDARAFADAFDAATAAASSTRLSTFGGTINVRDVPRAIAQIRARFAQTQERFDRRARCLTGEVFACEPGALDLSLPPVPVMGTSTDASAQAIGRLLAAAYPPDFRRDETVLASSSCVALLPGPYHFLIAEPGYSKQFFPIQFINELYFLPTSHTNGPVPAYLKQTYGISLLRVNPMDFYTCPDVLSDMGTMRAIVMAASIARTHSEVASAERAPLLGTVLREDDALAYLHAAASVVSEPDRNEIIAAALAFEERSAGLDDLVGQIAGVVARDVSLKEAGVPFDLSAQTFFLTHSAFSSLFLAHNPSAGTIPIAITEADAASFEKLLGQYRTYSSVTHTVAPAEILRDVAGFYDFEYVSKGVPR